MEKIQYVDLTELENLIGSHKYEIIDISTEWCQPCKAMKKDMEKIFKSKDFKDVDIRVYVVDGDVCTELVQKKEMIENFKKDGIDFPISVDKFIEYLKANSEVDEDEFDWNSAVEYVANGFLLKKEDGKISLSDDYGRFINIFNPYTEFDVGGFPTIVFYKDGKPVEEPLVPDDYESRGFLVYDEEKMGDMEGRKIEIDSRKGKMTLIQPDKKLDARIVGYGGYKNLKKILKKFISM